MIQDLKSNVENGVYQDLTSIVVLVKDSIYLEEYYNGATRKSTHDVRSVGKTFASTLLGMAIADGYLRSEKQSLGEFYDLRQYENYDERKSSVTLQDLLTMSSSIVGYDFDQDSPGNEALMYPTENWVHFALDLPMKPVGERKWQYFTAGAVILGDVIHQNVPGGLESYAERKLFNPLGITSQIWEYTPQGVANTAGGIEMTSGLSSKYRYI